MRQIAIVYGLSEELVKSILKPEQLILVCDNQIG
jgi:hypothetical protein